MIRVSNIILTPPSKFKSELQRLAYEALETLQIPFERVDNDAARTMEDCIAIDAALQCKVVKTLFLCNRQKTCFYYFITEGNKPFVTKNFGKALGVSRVSFAPEDLLSEKAGVEPGATTVFGVLLDQEREIRVVIDEDILREEFFGCTDGTLTTYMKIRTDDVFRLLEYSGHRAEIININL